MADPQRRPAGALGRAWTMLSNRDRYRLGLLMVASLVGTFLELFSLGAIVPLISLLVDSRDTYEIWWFGDTRLIERGQLIVGAAIALAMLFFLRAIALIYVRWRIVSFNFALQVRLQEELFRRYLSQGYEFFLNRNSSLLAYRVNSASAVVSGVVDPVISVLTDGLISIGLVLVLFYFEPFATLVTLSFFGLASFGFHRFTTSRIRSWGAIRKQFASDSQVHLYQGLQGIKDVKIFGREKLFADRLSTALKAGIDPAKKFSLVQFIPRIGLEFIAVSAFSVVVVSMVLTGSDLNRIVPTVALFSVAAFRIMPAFSRVIHSSQSVDHARELIRDLGDDYDLGISTFSFTNRNLKYESVGDVVVENVSYRYPDTDRAVLDDVSFVIAEGEMVGVVGTSGGGKSTLVDLLIGLLTPMSGKIRAGGGTILSDLRRWQDSIGYVPQSLYLVDDSIRANVAFGLNPSDIDDDRVWEALKGARLDQFVAGLPEGLASTVGERGVRLSGGQRQRIGIARALYGDPPFLILDEATSSLDNATESEFMEVVWGLRKSKTILIVAHRTSTVERCDKVIRIEAGKVVQVGGPEVIRQS
jgi:ABC-type multidrug transport system fused ATPase/permease subunit